MNKPWFSPFTGDASVPDSSSEYTLEVTNPNLLVKEETQADILWVNDTDNPGSFNDPALTPNPFGPGELFYEAGKFGSKVSISTLTNGGPGGANEVQRISSARPRERSSLLFGAADRPDPVQRERRADPGRPRGAPQHRRG